VGTEVRMTATFVLYTIIGALFGLSLALLSGLSK
jgi:hypothetical protein